MTPDLIAKVLSQSLPVRLSLLDADPNGMGCLVPVGASEPYHCYVVMRVTPYERKRAQDGAAWLPANPLAIVEHAERLHPSGWLTVAHHADVGWRFDIMVSRNGEAVSVCSGDSKCPHTAAIALLREVVG